MYHVFTGKAYENLFAFEAIKREIIVAQPQVDVGYDFLVEYKRKYNRVQIKSTSSLKKRQNNSQFYQIGAHKTYKNKKAKYDKNDCDSIAVYLTQHDIWYLIPVTEINSATIYIYPDNKNHKYEKYRDNWEILK